MAYCEPEDLGRFGVNAQAIEDISAEDELQPVIDATAAKIDSYLRQRFTLPLVSWGDDLKACNACLAACDVLRVRGWKPGENPEDSAVEKACEEWLAWLKMVAEGKVTPVVEEPPATGGAVSPSAPLIATNVSRGWQDDYRGMPSGVPFAGRRR